MWQPHKYACGHMHMLRRAANSPQHRLHGTLIELWQLGAACVHLRWVRECASPGRPPARRPSTCCSSLCVRTFCAARRVLQGRAPCFKFCSYPAQSTCTCVCSAGTCTRSATWRRSSRSCCALLRRRHACCWHARLPLAAPPAARSARTTAPPGALRAPW